MKLHSFQQYSHDLERGVHDTWITARVKSALAMAEPSLGLQIHVKTHGGTVALSGRVNTHKQCEQAVALARSVQGVVDIDAKDLLTHVFTPGSIPEPPNAEESAEIRPQSSAKMDDK
ncbi:MULTISPECIES: BON domain-containing protein [unclassified Pseudomonas]|uniref:BON domain-containing protein n=1 Tax=Pseudomonas TaxID=286 RepID=UPI00101244C3|nr:MULTISPECIES: BON domain-containing protein [unclassified Pseudomonas]QAY93957.1 phospholipid-binding protein [Pseudomonas sp. ACM7]TFB34468.1 BON domain-containing protein [Pseudomonas sp. F01002]